MNLLKKLVPYLLIACLAGCVANPPMEKDKPSVKMDSASFQAYAIRVIASDANKVRCDYGPHRVADYVHIPPGTSIGEGGSMSFFRIYGDMKCTWADAEGNHHQAMLDMSRLLRNMHVEWEHIEGETVVERDPLQSSPEFHVKILGNQIAVMSSFTVLILSDPISETRRKLKPIPISRTLIELVL